MRFSHFEVCHYSDECDQLASTIGCVMEEAESKVESDIEKTKREYVERMKCLEDTIERLVGAKGNDTKEQRKLVHKIKTLEAELEQSHRINRKLAKKLQIASKTIVIGRIFIRFILQ